MPFFSEDSSTAFGCFPPPAIPEPGEWSTDTITLSWIGHATILINFQGIWVLTDPVLFDRVGIDVWGLFTLGPKRIFAPALSLDQMPQPDLVLLSHAHMDHLDYPTLKALTALYPKQLTVVTAANTADIIEHLRWKQLIELDWNEQYRFKGMTIEAIPVKHFGWRFPWEQDRSRGALRGRSYNAYLLERNGKTVVFGGDTAWTKIFQKYSDIDIAILPIGAYQPWHHVHCTPEEAVDMALMMGARVVAPMHCTTFVHGREPFWEPPKRFRHAIQKTSALPAWTRVGETFAL